jgi:hypothetical protein
MYRRIWLYVVLAVVNLLAVAVAASAGGVWASRPAEHVGVTPPDDGYDALPRWLQGISMSSLVQLGLVNPQPLGSVPPEVYSIYQNPTGPIVWGPPHNMSNFRGSNEPGAALHPTNSMFAISGGNRPSNGTIINNTTDGGDTWQHRNTFYGDSVGDGAPAWLAANVNEGRSALYSDLTSPTGFDLIIKLAKTTDAGVTWDVVPKSNVHADGLRDDRQYLWTDHNPSSPYYGRLYLTVALFARMDISYNGISVRWSTDEGVTWSPVVPLVDTTEFQRGENHNEFASLAIQPDGAVVAAWHRGMCCGCCPAANVPNKVMWSRSTDGGTTFPISGTIVTVPISQSVNFLSRTPGNFRWTDAPNIAADPVDGTLYAVWTAYRQPAMPTTAATYLSRGTPDASTWTEPVIVDDSHPDRYQYLPWVDVSRDHVVHVTYGAAVSSNTSLGQFYMQSTDGGKTFSKPFMLSEGEFPAAVFMGDYQPISIGGYSGDNASIFATWTQGDTTGGTDQWGRIGTFSLSGPTHTPTPTATFAPTNTPTPTSSPTNTSTPFLTPCTLTFTDVHPTDYFYTAVQYLYCHGIISGYADNTFRPYNNTTRAQLCKIVVLAEGWPLDCPTPGHFSDVPPDNPFFCYIETAYNHAIISGYADGTFRPGNNVTRAQLCKIVVLAEAWPDDCPTPGHFTDVPPTDPFFCYIETAYSHSIISGYADGTFRPGNSATRGQISKIVYQAITQP